MLKRIKGVMALVALVGATALAGGVALANESGVPVPAVPKFDQSNAKKYGTALATYTDRRDAGWRDFYAKARMTLIDARGDKVQRDVMFLVLEQPEGNRAIIRFRSPADVRGIAALIHERPGATDDTWLYLPASRRTRRISGANRTASFQGTEFTYEDLSRLRVENYHWKFLENTKTNGEPTFKVEAKPKYRDTGYSKLHVHIHRKHWRVEQVEYFDQAGRHLKTFTQSKWKLLHGRFWRAHVTKMVNHQTRKTTHVNMPSMFLNLSLYKRRDGSARDNLSASDFTKRALESN